MFQEIDAHVVRLFEVGRGVGPSLLLIEHQLPGSAIRSSSAYFEPSSYRTGVASQPDHRFSQ